MLIGGAGATGVWHAHEHLTCPTGGVGPGVEHTETQSVKGARRFAAVAWTMVESYWTVRSYALSCEESSIDNATIAVPPTIGIEL
jgi:hypothetical protein